jgi:hypothetical protein
MALIVLGLDLVALRLGGSLLFILDPIGDLLEKSGNKVPLPLSAALMIFRAGSLGALSLCTVGRSASFLLRRGLNRGDAILGDWFMNTGGAGVLSELGAGIGGVLGPLVK